MEKIIMFQIMNTFVNIYFNGRIDYKIALLKALREEKNG